MMRSKHLRDTGQPAPNPWGSCIARKRCPRCKKVRAKWFGANYLWPDKPRAMWQRFDGQLVWSGSVSFLGATRIMPPTHACTP